MKTMFSTLIVINHIPWKMCLSQVPLGIQFGMCFFFSVIFHPLMNSKAGSPCEVERREALGLEGAGSAVFLPPTHGFSYHVD